MEHTTHNNPHNTRHITHNKLLRVTCYVLREKGFSLLEVLVAIAVITVGLVGVIGLIAYTISISRVSPDKVIATNLAQEGIEVIRNIRDTNWLEGDDFDEDIGGPGMGNRWRGTVDYNSAFITKPPGSAAWISVDDCIAAGEDCRLKINASGVYSHVGGTDTSFYRLILTDKMTPDSLKVVSQVGWTDRSGPHTITLEDHLYDWKQ